MDYMFDRMILNILLDMYKYIHCLLGLEFLHFDIG
jgi:hypothetical protein